MTKLSENLNKNFIFRRCVGFVTEMLHFRNAPKSL